MAETQNRIITYLKQHNIASAIELSQALVCTPANIRHHLHILLENGVVEITGRRVLSGGGHPVYLYRLKLNSYRHNFPNLVNTLLNILSQPALNIDRSNLVQPLAEQLGSLLPGSSGNLVQRLSQAVHNLEGMAYEPRWEARREGPRFMFANCPYAAVLPAHPELCQMDALLLEKLLGTQVQQTSRLSTGAPGNQYCVFLLGVS